MTEPARILIASHETKSLRSYDAAMRRSGFQTHLTKTGEETLDQYREFKPDLCIIDTMLTGVDGFSVCKQITEETADFPVVIVTGIYKGERHRKNAFQKFGASAYLEKPFPDEELIREVKSLLNKGSEPVSQAPSGKSNQPSMPMDPEEPSATMRVDPADLKREMAKLKAEMTGPEAQSEDEANKANSRVKVTQKESADLSDQFTSNDIFGSLIDDIEAGRVNEREFTMAGDNTVNPEEEAPQEAEVEPEPVAVPVPEVKTQTTAVPQPGTPKGENIFTTQPLPELSMDDTIPDADPPTPVTRNQQGGNEYQLIEKIAAGGMAEVWKARLVGEKGFEKIVAIKKILSHLSGNEEFITMFIDEAKVAANLTHPNIAQIYELGKMGDSFFIAMEYVAGYNLRYLFNQCKALNVKMAPEIVAYIGMKLCSALHYAHVKKNYSDKALNIVHRDVSPQNILISTEGETKLVDFGIAKASIKATQTVAGSLKGKLLYMSPEQADGKQIDNRSDIFSLGSVLYEALTGIKLFSGDSEISILKNVRQAKYRQPRDVNPDLPAKLCDIILTALTRKVDDRYRYAKDLGNDLKEFLKVEKIHITESDVSDYLRLIINKDRDKLAEYTSIVQEEEPAQAQPAAPQGNAADKARVIMPDPVEDTFSRPPSAAPQGPAGSSGMGKKIAAGVVILVLIAVLAYVATSGSDSDQAAIPATNPAVVAEQAPTTPVPAPISAPSADAAAPDSAKETTPAEDEELKKLQEEVRRKKEELQKLKKDN